MSVSRIPLRDGQSLAVRVLGRGRPVLMLHGLGMRGDHWLPFILPHLSRHRFYLPDLRGAGRSADTPFKSGDIFQAHAEDVQDLIRHFGLDELLLAGISLGATTALHLHQLDGFSGVSRYLHIDQSPCIGNRSDWPHGLFGARQEALFGTLRGILDRVNDYPACRRFADLPASVRHDVGADLADVLALMAGGRGLKPLLSFLMRLPAPVLARIPLPLADLGQMRTYLPAYVAGGHDYRTSLATCRIPITVFLGARSPLYAEAGQRVVAAHHPASRVVRFERSGHVPLKDEPLRFAREFAGFLATA